MRKFFVSFASPKMITSLRRISKQAESMGMFDRVMPFELDDLEVEFRSAFNDKLQEDIRGFGCWAWKAQIIKQTLSEMDDGDQLLYADAGCHLNPHGKLRLKQYFDMLSTDIPFVVFQQDPKDSVFGGKNPHIISFLNKNWIKGDLLDHYDIRNRDDFLSQETLYATTFLMQKNDMTNKFIHDWLKPIQTNWRLIDDSPSVSPNLPSFIEHRHDQSIFSILGYLYPVNIISSCEIIYPKTNGRGSDWNKLRQFPIHVRRDRRDKFSSRLKGVKIDISIYLQELLRP